MRKSKALGGGVVAGAVVLVLGLCGPASGQNADPSKAPAVPKIDLAPKPVRLRMELQMLKPVSQHQDLGLPNTENEIYYGVSASNAKRSPLFRIVRRTGDPNIWEMGFNSATKLQRWLFRGAVSPLDPVHVGVVLAEQEGHGGTPTVPGSWGTMFDPAVRPILVELANRVHHDASMSEMGAIDVGIRGARMTVQAGPAAKVVSASDTQAVIDLRDGSYRMQLTLEEDSGAAPTGLAYLGLEMDNCGEASLYVTGSGGDVHLSKGETKQVPISAQRFDWHCGGSLEHATARPGTQVLEVRRATGDNRRVQWKCLRKETLAPDLTW